MVWQERCGGDPSQLLAECIGAVTNVVFVFVASMIFFKILDQLVGNRVPGYTEYLPRPVERGYGENSVTAS